MPLVLKRQTPAPAREHIVKCAATISVWVEADGAGIPARHPVKVEAKKRVTFRLTGSAPYRGDAVLCNYATGRRDVTTSYSVRCLQARKQRGQRNSYLCQ